MISEGVFIRVGYACGGSEVRMGKRHVGVRVDILLYYRYVIILMLCPCTV